MNAGNLDVCAFPLMNDLQGCRRALSHGVIMYTPTGVPHAVTWVPPTFSNLEL